LRYAPVEYDARDEAHALALIAERGFLDYTHGSSLPRDGIQYIITMAASAAVYAAPSGAFVVHAVI